jgi:hypothetical protein
LISTWIFEDHFLLYLGFQIATVQGGVRNCGDIDYPGIYIRLVEPEVLNFIKATITNDEKSRGKNQSAILSSLFTENIKFKV